MYKLTLEIREGCKLEFDPKKSNEVRKIFMNDTYWYPQKIEEKRFISLNISSADTLKEFIPSALLQGNIFGAFPINDNDVCYVYSGSLRSTRISAFLGLRPLYVSKERLFYFFTDEDFKNICQDVKTYAKKVIENSSGPVSLTAEDLNVLKKIEETPLTSIATNLDLYSRFFEIYCDERCVKAHLTPKEPCEYCTAKVGLHPLLHVVKLVPSDTWIKGYYKDFLIYLLQQDFLVDWVDIKNLDETRQSRILSEAKKIVSTIKNVKDFKKVVEETIKNMINRRDIFKILYYLSRYEDSSTTLKAMFDNLFYLLPKKTEEYLFYPKFQPKLFVDGFELHFIMMAKYEEDIVQMDKDLREIFDETDYSKTVPSRVSSWLFRYRFKCKVKIGGRYVDYIDLPDVIEDTCNAIRALANRNGVHFVPGEPGLSESWLKRMSMKIVTPPQFEYAIFKAFAFLRKWDLRRKVSEDVERMYLFSVVGFEKDLDKGVVPEILKKKFKTEGFSLSENAIVEKGADNEWRITDNENIFVVRKGEEEKERLNIYAMLKCKIISADVRCEYPGLVSHQARFDYLRDVQSFYGTLNGLLEKEFDFKVFG